MLTIVKDLKKISPAFNPVEIQISSPLQGTKSDFRYIVRISDADGNLIATKRLVGGSNASDVITFDVSKQLSQLQSFNGFRFDVVNSEFIYKDLNFRKGFSVNISEYYDAAEYDSKTIAAVYTIPASLSSIEFPFFNYDIVKNSGRWLTNFERINLRTTDKATVGFLCPSFGVSSFTYEFFDSNNNKLASVLKMCPATVEDVLFLHVGLSDLKTFTGVSSDVVDKTSTYTIKPANCAVMRFNVVPKDLRFAGARVHYLNEWGAMDSFLFNLAAQRSVNIEKKNAKLKATGTNFRPSIFGINTTPYAVQYNDVLKLTSEFISDNDSQCLTELFTSPLVTVEIDKSVFFPATSGERVLIPAEIGANSYSIKQSNADRLFNVEIELKVSVDNTRQTL